MKYFKFFIFSVLLHQTTEILGQQSPEKLKFSEKFNFEHELNSKYSSIQEYKSELLISGSTRLLDSREVIHAICTDTLGIFKWSKRYFLDGKSLNLHESLIGDNGSQILSGVISDSIQKSLFVVKINSSGQIQFSKSFEATSNIENINDIKNFGNEIFIVGSLQTHESFVLKIDSNANVISSFQTQLSDSISIHKIINIYDEKIAFVASKGSGQIAFLELDTSLNQMICRNISMPGTFYKIESSKFLNDSLLCITGYGNNPISLADDGLICIYNIASKQVRKVYSVSLPNDLKFLGLEVLNEKEIILSGQAEYFGNGSDNGFIMKMNLDNPTSYEGYIFPDLYSSKIHASHIASNKGLYLCSSENEIGLTLSLTRLDTLKFCDIETMKIALIESQENIAFTSNSLTSLQFIEAPIAISSNDLTPINTSICRSGNCQLQVNIISDKTKPCIGDQIVFKSLEKLDKYEWYLNGQLISNQDSFVHLRDKADISMELKSRNQEGCSGYDVFYFESDSIDFEIIGESEICKIGEDYIYVFDYNSKFDLEYSLFNEKSLNQIGDSLIVNWENFEGKIEASISDSSSCFLAYRELNIQRDSGITIPPYINVVSENLESDLLEISFELYDYQNNLEDITYLEHVVNDNWIELTRLLDNEKIWIYPDTNEASQRSKFRIKSINNCEVEIYSDIHQRINLDFRNEQFEWGSYSAWSDFGVSYELIQNGNNNQPIIPFSSYIPKIIDDWNSCYRIRATNGSFNSYSNEICLQKNFDLFLPNVLTVNGDGKNDFLIIDNIDLFKDYLLLIYDRWGQLIFKSSLYDNHWPPPSINNGTYFYELNIDQGKNSLNGFIHILK